MPDHRWLKDKDESVRQQMELLLKVWTRYAKYERDAIVGSLVLVLFGLAVVYQGIRHVSQAI